MKIRLIALVDFEADSLKDAYRQLGQAMQSTGLSWETSDEFYVDGEEGEPDALQRAIEDDLRDRVRARSAK